MKRATKNYTSFEDNADQNDHWSSPTHCVQQNTYPKDHLLKTPIFKDTFAGTILSPNLRLLDRVLDDPIVHYQMPRKVYLQKM